MYDTQGCWTSLLNSNKFHWIFTGFFHSDKNPLVFSIWKNPLDYWITGFTHLDYYSISYTVCGYNIYQHEVDTIAVLNKSKAFQHFNFVSTAGGAFLEYLEGKEIPGITALI